MRPRRYLVVAAGLAAILVLARLLEPGAPLPVGCPFKALTGLPCVGCGMTRGFEWMARGEVERAAQMNPMAVILFPLTGLAMVGCVAAGLGWKPPAVRVPAPVIAGGVVLLMLWWVWRIAEALGWCSWAP